LMTEAGIQVNGRYCNMLKKVFSKISKKKAHVNYF
jgi:hypothetical protein